MSRPDETRGPNGVRRHELASWNDFHARVQASALPGQRVFRGQRDPSWPVASPWERWLATRRDDLERGPEGATLDGRPIDEIREDYLRRFKEQCLGLPDFESAGLDDHDWWALGRHYGLTTPLLDWSTSPYVAAFFAFLNSADELNPGFSDGTHHGDWRCGEGRVAVWELVLTRELLALDELEVLLPKLDRTHRRRAQGGYFTRLNDPEHLDLESYLESKGLAHCLALYALPERDARQALRDLYLMDIHPSRLFPDFSGAAAMANLLPQLH